MMAPPDLDALHWHNRVVIVFGSEKNKQMLQQQSAQLAGHSQGCEERDIKVFTVMIDSPGARDLQEKLHVSRQAFAVVLIGKDGSVKLRKTEPVTADELFQTIDQMPMRRQEMKRP